MLDDVDRVRQLEHDAEDEPHGHRHEQIDAGHAPRLVAHQGKDERHGQEERLAAEQPRQVGALGVARAQAVVLAEGQPLHVAVEIAQVHQGVEPPQIDVLVAVPPVPRLIGTEPRHRPEVDVGILGGNVRVHVMVVVVLVLPEVRAGADEIQREPGEAVDPRTPGEGAVVAVVLDVEADADQRQGKQRGPHQGPECRLAVEHERRRRTRSPRR